MQIKYCFCNISLPIFEEFICLECPEHDLTIFEKCIFMCIWKKNVVNMSLEIMSRILWNFIFSYVLHTLVTMNFWWKSLKREHSYTTFKEDAIRRREGSRSCFLPFLQIETSIAAQRKKLVGKEFFGRILQFFFSKTALKKSICF